MPTMHSESSATLAEFNDIRRSVGGLDSSIQAVSALRGVEIIDLEWAVDESAIKTDGVHPDGAGAKQMASVTHYPTGIFEEL